MGGKLRPPHVWSLVIGQKMYGFVSYVLTIACNVCIMRYMILGGIQNGKNQGSNYG